MIGPILHWVSRALRALSLLGWSLVILSMLNLFAKKYVTLGRIRRTFAAIWILILGLTSDRIRHW